MMPNIWATIALIELICDYVACVVVIACRCDRATISPIMSADRCFISAKWAHLMVALLPDCRAISGAIVHAIG